MHEQYKKRIKSHLGCPWNRLTRFNRFSLPCPWCLVLAPTCGCKKQCTTCFDGPTLTSPDCFYCLLPTSCPLHVRMMSLRKERFSPPYAEFALQSRGRGDWKWAQRSTSSGHRVVLHERHSWTFWWVAKETRTLVFQTLRGKNMLMNLDFFIIKMLNLILYMMCLACKYIYNSYKKSCDQEIYNLTPLLDSPHDLWCSICSPSRKPSRRRWSICRRKAVDQSCRCLKVIIAKRLWKPSWDGTSWGPICWANLNKLESTFHFRGSP